MDADILEYILAKLAARNQRIAAKSRTFVVKVKTHRGEPLNEGVVVNVTVPRASLSSPFSLVSAG